MTEWALRRFWTDVDVRAEDGGHAVHLDGRPVRTPYRAPLVAPTPALAEAVAEEWRAQQDEVRPETMPFTRALNSALDKVAPDPAAVARVLADYAGTDLVCYRATHPAELVARQAEVWDPYLDWTARTYGATLRPVFGIMPEDQDAVALALLSKAVHRYDPMALTALYEVVTLTGSLVLGLAGLSGFRDAASLWHAARLDELWQIEQWGADDEAEAVAEARRAAIEQALRFYALCRRAA